MYVGDDFKEHRWVVETAESVPNNHTQRFADWYQWKQTQDSMEREAKKINSVRKQIGWTNCNSMKRIASMPLHIHVILRRIDPEMFAQTKEGYRKFDRFLIKFPEFSVRW